MQPHGSGTRAAIEAEGEGALARVSYTKDDVSDASPRPLPFSFNGGPGARRRGVFDLLPADFQRMLRLNNFLFGNGRLLFFFRLFRSFVRWWLLLRETQTCAQEK